MLLFWHIKTGPVFHGGVASSSANFATGLRISIWPHGVSLKLAMNGDFRAKYSGKTRFEPSTTWSKTSRDKLIWRRALKLELAEGLMCPFPFG